MGYSSTSSTTYKSVTGTKGPLPNDVLDRLKRHSGTMFATLDVKAWTTVDPQYASSVYFADCADEMNGTLLYCMIPCNTPFFIIEMVIISARVACNVMLCASRQRP